MGIKYSGKILSTGKSIVDYKDSPSGPQGVNLIHEYDATLNSLPTSQGWTGPTTSSSLVDDDIDGVRTLQKATTTLAYYEASAPVNGWMVELDVRVESSGTKPYSHALYLATTSNQRNAYEFNTDSIEVYAAYNSWATIATGDFQTAYRNIKLLDNTESGFVELYIDDVLITDSISVRLNTGTQAVRWGDFSSANALNRIAYWRSVKVYESWSK